MYGLLILILGVNFIVLFCVRRHMKRQMNTEMNSQVQNTVSQYFALSSDSNAV